MHIQTSGPIEGRLAIVTDVEPGMRWDAAAGQASNSKPTNYAKRTEKSCVLTPELSSSLD